MEITVFCNGDSSDPSTWSNVPYFITNGLIECGHKINRVNISQYQGIEKYISFAFDKIIITVIKIIFPQTTYCYGRSIIRRKLAENRMKKSVKKYPHTDLFISLTFSFNPYRFTDSKIINMCDWTYEFDIMNDHHKVPDVLEKREIKSEKLMIKNADLNVVFRTECRLQLMNEYDNIYGEPCKVINSDYVCNDANNEEIINAKEKSSSILFIGASRYAEGAKNCALAINELVKKGVQVTAYYIGLKREDIDYRGDLSENNIFLGYLKKGDANEKELYYKRILEAKLAINTNPEFISLAGITEAASLYTPVIVSKHSQTLASFGDNSSFVFYTDNDFKNIADRIENILFMDKNKYRMLCKNAHDFYKDYSWKQLLNKVLKQL